jgi:hypothetical protein
MRYLRDLFCLLVPTILLACTSDPIRSEHTFEIVDEGGIPIALSRGGPKYGAELFRYEFVTELREDEREESILAGPRTPFIDEEGHIYMPDGVRSAARIAVFDANGRYECTIGHFGEGPGEFRHAEIQSVADGHLDVFDSTQRRLTRFRTDGSCDTVITIPPSMVRMNVRFFQISTDERFVLISDTSNLRSEREILRMTATVYSAEWDPLSVVASEPVVGSRIITSTSGNQHYTGPADAPFLPKPQIVFSDRCEIVVTTGQEPILDIYGLDGRHTRRIRIDLPAEPVTAEIETRYKKEQETWIRSLPRDRQVSARKRLEDTEFPDEKAYWGEVFLGGLQVDEYGFIWIRIPEYRQEAGKDEGVIQYMVIGPTGEYLGITTLPLHNRGGTKFSRGYVITFLFDPDTDERLIRIYRMIPAVKGFSYP